MISDERELQPAAVTMAEVAALQAAAWFLQDYERGRGRNAEGR